MKYVSYQKNSELEIFLDLYLLTMSNKRFSKYWVDNTFLCIKKVPYDLKIINDYQLFRVYMYTK